MGNDDNAGDATGTTIRLDGHHDVSNASTIVDGVRAAVQDGAREVVLDMSEVVFMDSTALGALIKSKKFADAHGAVLTLEQVPENTARLLSLTALDQVFTISSTRADSDDTD